MIVDQKLMCSIKLFKIKYRYTKHVYAYDNRAHVPNFTLFTSLTELGCIDKTWFPMNSPPANMFVYSLSLQVAQFCKT